MLEVTIKIPDDFKGDYDDKLQEFFGRVIADMDFKGLCGQLEKETAEMLKQAFAESTAREI